MIVKLAIIEYTKYIIFTVYTFIPAKPITIKEKISCHGSTAKNVCRARSALKNALWMLFIWQKERP